MPYFGEPPDLALIKSREKGAVMENNETAQAVGTDLESLTDQIEEGVRKGKYSWTEIQDAVVTKTREAAETTDQYVHENPWKVVGIAAGLGFVLGLLMAPRSDD
ncbi:MAG TPA: DUF883 domain-containing protein [Verrucomicrobiae bacterium]|nr:DUF883 domain-containing protein [Verrucomicrobiae bacterium]